jgi:hypothetical protein
MEEASERQRELSARDHPEVPEGDMLAGAPLGFESIVANLVIEEVSIKLCYTRGTGTAALLRRAELAMGAAGGGKDSVAGGAEARGVSGTALDPTAVLRLRLLGLGVRARMGPAATRLRVALAELVATSDLLPGSGGKHAPLIRLVGGAAGGAADGAAGSGAGGAAAAEPPAAAPELMLGPALPHPAALETHGILGFFKGRSEAAPTTLDELAPAAAGTYAALFLRGCEAEVALLADLVLPAADGGGGGAPLEISARLGGADLNAWQPLWPLWRDYFSPLEEAMDLLPNDTALLKLAAQDTAVFIEQYRRRALCLLMARRGGLLALARVRYLRKPWWLLETVLNPAVVISAVTLENIGSLKATLEIVDGVRMRLYGGSLAAPLDSAAAAAAAPPELVCLVVPPLSVSTEPGPPPAAGGRHRIQLNLLLKGGSAGRFFF